MVVRRIFIFLCVAWGTFWAQSNLRVPLTNARQCEGSNCPGTQFSRTSGTVDSELQDQLNARGFGRVSTNGISGEQFGADDINGAAQAGRPVQMNLQYPPPEERTEFQDFVYSSTGQQLSIYGHNLFENVPSTFAPVDRIPVPADYALGPGDELLIRAWGQIDLDARVVVDRNGQIYLPKIGTVSVAGLRYEQLNVYLMTTIGRLFKNFDLNVNLGQLRSIQILVLGRARRPGTYTISSLSTLVNALFASGGPASSGSMRHIELRRQSRVVTEFDLYDLLVRGDKSKDVLLLPGDVIYIPPAGRMVALTGSLNLPAIYEVQENTSVREAIEMAGLNTTADGSRAILERIDNRNTRKVEEFALDDGGLSRTLSDGDILRIFPLSPRFENAVTLRGNVSHPGRYTWRNGMRVRDLIPCREAVITRDYWSRQNALSRNSAGWTDGLAEQRTEFKRNPAEINWDYAVVQRLNHEDLSSKLLAFNLGRAIENAGSEDNLPLETGDVITVFSQADLAVPLEKRTKFVWVQGEVKAPGVYRVQPGETLRDLVARAGMLTPNAYLYAAEFTRDSTRVEQQKELERTVEDMDKELRSKAALLAASGTAEERLAAQQQIAAGRDLLEKLRQTKATGRIVLDLKPTDTDASALPSLPLEDGDRLTIPAKPATVQVMGAVYNQNSFMHKPNKTLGYYLSEAGGGTRDADRGRLFVIRADGSVDSKQMHKAMWVGSFESLKLMPGDTIVMPQRIRTHSSLTQIRDWTQIFSQLALGAAAVNVLK